MPVPLIDLVPAVGRDFSDVVARLLEKDSGRRYRSAAGPAYDLSQPVRGKPLHRLAEHDCPERLLQVSLVGRAREQQTLRAVLSRCWVCEGLMARQDVIGWGGRPGVRPSQPRRRLR